MIVLPEINIARRLTKLKKLVPPVDILALAAEFATVELLEFPTHLNVDGVCLNAKSCERIKIIVNTYGRNDQRIRFTVAHELGHVLIPWHNSSIVDELDVLSGQAGLEYRVIEGEANRFETELLMPSEWVAAITQRYPSPIDMTRAISREGNVSYQAAVIRLASLLPRGYVYAAVDERGYVEFSDRSPGTIAAPPLQAEVIRGLLDLYKTATAKWSEGRGNLTYYWWHWVGKSALPESEGSFEWRALLNDMVDRLKIPEVKAKKLKASINGTIAFANGSIKQDRTVEAVYDTCLQRFYARPQSDAHLRALISLPEFKQFLSLRAKELVGSH